MKKAMSLNLMLLVSFMSLATEQLTDRVVSVIDGNTLEVMGDDHEMYKILLHGIDCPELDQEFGITARKMLERLVLEKEVLVIIQGKDRLGNRLGVITGNGKSDPRFELLNEGLAWTSEKNPIEELEVIKDKARENSKGLWQEQNPTAPWIFRRQQTMMQFKSS
jgi:micrococcal nuclease